MVQGQRVILEGGEAVGLARMPGVPGLGEQGEIGQFQRPGQPSSRRLPFVVAGGRPNGVNREEVDPCRDQRKQEKGQDC